MKTIYFRVGKDYSKRVAIQYEHRISRIVFVNIDFAGRVALNVNYKNKDGIDVAEAYELQKVKDGYELELGYPLTLNSGEIKSQIIGSYYDNSGMLMTKSLSNTFSLIIDESLAEGDIAEPIDPLIPIGNFIVYIEHKLDERTANLQEAKEYIGI